MPMINTASDLLEVTFTPEEKAIAMQLMDKTLSQLYLQNTRVQIFRQIASLTYKPEERDRSILEHASLMGQIEILDTLIEGLLNPEQPPVNPATSTQHPQGN